MRTIQIKSWVSLFFPIISFIPICCLLFVNDKRRLLVKCDVEKWKEYTELRNEWGFLHSLSYLLVWFREFRNLYYRRIGGILGKILMAIIPGDKTLNITSSPIGGGFFVRHGYSTFVNTKSIGTNCVIHQNTTIGDDGRGGIPTIGNNVYIGTGAIVLGPITIGNNVTIAAGAIVVENVPSNSKVIGTKAKIYRE